MSNMTASDTPTYTTQYCEICKSQVYPPHHHNRHDVLNGEKICSDPSICIIGDKDTKNDNRCRLKTSHREDHVLPDRQTTHKCKGTLDCIYCGGYWLKGFNRCEYEQVMMTVWVRKKNE